MTYPKYEKYKESGVPWLGQVPEGWEVAVIKHMTDIYNGSTPKSGDPLNWDGEILWATPEDLGNNNGKYLDNTKRTITEEGYISSGVSIVPIGSSILSTRAPIGHLSIVSKEMCFNQGCRGIVPKENLESDFLYYLLFAAKDELKVRGQGTTFIELGNNQLGSMPITLPSLEEQKAIAAFLDKKTSEIDALIAKKEELLKLLAEQRTALITHAVTKGLNPSAPMKDSGIDWLGHIPSHWDVKKVKSIVDIWGRIGFRGYTLADIVDEGEGALSLSPSNIKDGKTDYSKRTYISWEKYEESSEIKVYEGDILFVKTGSTIGKTAIIKSPNEPMTLNPQLVVLKNHKINSHFLAYAMNASYYQFQIEGYKFGGSTPAMTQESLGRTLIVIPSDEEQKEIVEYIDAADLKFELIINKTQQAIDRLKEYRTALITNAVTGKIDVRGYQQKQEAA